MLLCSVLLNNFSPYLQINNPSAYFPFLHLRLYCLLFSLLFFFSPFFGQNFRFDFLSLAPVVCVLVPLKLSVDQSSRPCDLKRHPHDPGQSVLGAPDPRRASRLRAKRRHPDSQNPHLLPCTELCPRSPTTSQQHVITQMRIYSI